MADPYWILAVVGAILLVLVRAWYEIVVQSTDDRAAAVRSMVNLGRRPLADSLGLQLPDTFEDERAMWSLVASPVARPYHPRRARLDRYRNPCHRRKRRDAGPGRNRGRHPACR
jgi:hypothetical protein